MTAATGKPRRQQLYLLGTLSVVLAVLAYVQFGGRGATTPAAPQAGNTTTPSNQATGTGGRGGLPVSDVRLDALKREQAEIADAERNPFRFKPKPAPPPPVQSTPPPQTYVPPPIATGPPPPPPIQLKFIGYYGTAPQRYAVLSDARGTPFYGREGDVIDGRYRILRVATDSVDVAYADGRGRQTLRLLSQ
jgi:hypothetical protein